MKSYGLPAVLTLGTAIVFALGCSDKGNPDIAASVGDQKLTALRLGDIIGNSQVPLEKDFARTVSELWVNYQLAGMAAVKHDTVTDPKDMDYGLWSMIENGRTLKFGEQIKKTMKPVDTGCNEECLYNKGGIVLYARHILIAASDGTQERAGPAVTPEQRAIAEKKAQAIRAATTPANFLAQTAKTEEPQGAERKGDLGPFAPVGMMIEEFTKGTLATKPGEVSDVVRSAFGYHIIYRPTYAEVKDKLGQYGAAIVNHPQMAAESTYLASLDSAAKTKVDKNAPITVRAVARNPMGYANDNTTVAEWIGGKLTASKLADIFNATNPQAQLRQQILNPQMPDSQLVTFVKYVVRNQMIVRQTDSAKIVLDTAEMANLRMGFRTNLTGAWTQLQIDPARLDSVKSEAEKAKLVGSRIDTYFDKLVKNEIGYVDVAYPVARSLQKKYKFNINEAALDKAMERAKTVRGSADSLRAKQGPPTPGGAAAPTPPPAAGSTPPATPPPVKK